MIGLISNKYLRMNYKLIENINYCVYFISDGEYTKIGIAASLPNRIKQLQTGNPRKLKALYIIEFETQRQALEIENKLHKYFADRQVSGEWFAINDRNIFTACSRLGYRPSKPASKFDFEIEGIEIV